MKDELENTIPIKVLNEKEIKTRSEKNKEEISRAEKYSDIDAEVEKEKKAQEEAAEEALAEKNIAEAEALLNAEKKEEPKEEPKEEKDSEKKKESLITKIKNKWSSLTKKQKIVFSIIATLILIIIISLIVLLVVTLKKEKPVEKEEEFAPVIIDNYYYKDGSLYFLDEDDEELGSYECTNKDEKKCFVAINNYKDTFDVDQVVYESDEDVIQRLPIYNEDYVFVYDSEDETEPVINLYSITKNKTKETYTNVKAYDEDYLIVSDEYEKYGLIKIEDNKINTIIKPDYDYLGLIDGEKNLVAKDQKGYMIIDTNNKVLSKQLPLNTEIKKYNDNLIVVKNEDKYSVFDYELNAIVENCDFATIKDTYIGYVNSKKLYLKDKDKISYYEEGITLQNNNYVRKYIYTKNKRIKEVKVSFEISYENNKLQLIIHDAENKDAKYESIDTTEALANAKYEYMNYFKGKIYFYKDAEKNTLAGSYKCSNVNTINNANDELTSCKIASDSIFEDTDIAPSTLTNRDSLIPIINEKYVFISDGANIKLYDLENSKDLGTYTKVNSYTDNNGGKFTAKSGDIIVVAKNNKGKFGMLLITPKEVKVTYKFEYDNIQKFGDYMLTSKSSTWEVLDGQTSVVKGPDKFVGYTSDKAHWKAVSGSSYLVYNADGSKVTSTKFEYVELYSTYFAGVLNGKLKIYDYNGKELTSEYKLIVKEYVKVSNPSFKVSLKNETFTIYIYDGNGYSEFTEDIIKEKQPEPEQPENITENE